MLKWSFLTLKVHQTTEIDLEKNIKIVYKDFNTGKNPIL